jgi:integrase
LTAIKIKSTTPHKKTVTSVTIVTKCPDCGSGKIAKKGVRILSNGSKTQVLRCYDCGRNFSENYIRCQGQHGNRHLCAILEEAKKMDTVAEIKTTVTCDIKGKILEYCFKMKRDGYAESTIRLTNTALKVLMDRGAILTDPESVKEIISRQNWSGNRIRNVSNAYTQFLKFLGLTWDPPSYTITRKIPFIPTEQEIDDLIAGNPNTVATFLQLLKETAMRCGEAKRLLWINIDFEKNIITLNDPEKGSNPRIWKVTQKLMYMLAAMPKDSQRVFGESSIFSMKTTFTKARKRLAAKLQNPRLLNISFHTPRHWKATMEYHKTKDPYYVKQFLGHKCIQSTELYINIEHTLFDTGNDNFAVKVAREPEEVKALLEVGFEYVCQKDNLIFLRKPK